jgi:hypothetical protein
MPKYFPHQTVAWKLEEPPAFRRLSLSIIEMAVLTGVVLRLYRTIVVTHGPRESWWYLGGTFAVGIALLCAMATLHLGNYTVRQWFWRAPLFGAIEAAAEALTSLGLIALGRERLGSDHATFHDWPGMAAWIFLWRVTAVVGFAVLLAGVVQLVRYTLLKHEHRLHTVVAVHEEIVRQTAEHEKPS